MKDSGVFPWILGLGACMFWINSCNIAPPASAKPQITETVLTPDIGSPSVGSPSPFVVDGTEEPFKSPSAFEDSAKSAPPPTASSWVKQVYPIHIGQSSGCAVAVSSDTLLTAWHIVQSGGGYAYVGVNGQWVLGTVQPIQGVQDGSRDGAVIKLQQANASLQSMKVRGPVYGEEVELFGLKTRTKMKGRVSDARTVSLDPSEQGVSKGDSGGAVVASDGSLVGIIAAFESAQTSLGTPPNQRVVAITRADLFQGFVPMAVSQGFSSSPFNEPPPFMPEQQPQQFGMFSFTVPQRNYFSGSCSPGQYGMCAPNQQYQIQPGDSVRFRQTPWRTYFRIN